MSNTHFPRLEVGSLRAKLTNASCTAPQKQVAVASSSLVQPSLAAPARGKYGLDLSEWSVVDMIVFFKKAEVTMGCLKMLVK